MTPEPRPRWRCLLCRRHKFTQPGPHRCGSQYVKNFRKMGRLRGLDSTWEKVSDRA